MAAPFPTADMSIEALRALDVAARAGIAAAQVINRGFDAALMMDEDGVTIVFTVPIGPVRNPVAASATGPQPEVGAATSGNPSTQNQED